ncbi:MFS transporter [Magnetovibrio sp.]|uniref:MFS transporter n=1 Tax=Magnetovibrio sp. TaxID=2024836 RepID=UPI002F95BB7D
MNTLTFLIQNARFLGFGLACTLASNFGQTFFIALFGDHIRADFDLSHSDFGGLYAVATLLSATVILWAGRKIDRVDLRLYTGVVFAGLALSGALMAATYSPWVLVVAFFGLRLFGQGLLRHTAVVSMARYFDAARGRAMSVVGLGYPIAEATFPAALVVILSAISWREAWGGFALYIFTVHLPLALWLLKGHGVRHAALQERLKAEDADKGDLTQRRLMSDWRFQMIVPASLMGPFMMTGLFFHQLAIADSKGWDIGLLAASFPAFAGASVAASLISGWVVDRFGPGVVLPVFIAPLTLALIVVASLDQTWSAPLYFSLGGLTVGASGVLISAAWAETFGVRHLGAIRSLTSSMAVVSTALAPALVGWLLDAGISVSAIAYGGAGVALLTNALVLFPAKELRRKKTKASN